MMIFSLLELSGEAERAGYGVERIGQVMHIRSKAARHYAVGGCCLLVRIHGCSPGKNPQSLMRALILLRSSSTGNGLTM